MLFLLVALILGAAAYLAFLLIRRNPVRHSLAASALLALVTVLNPAIFYKLLAGHFYYLLGYASFVGLLLLLRSRLKEPLTFGIALGLLVALAGSQIQFFVFSLLTILVWMALNRKAYPLYSYIAAAFIALIIHGYWLIGFITGTNSVAALSAWAAQNSFESLSNASFVKVMTLSFSGGTFISNFYRGVLLLPGLLLVAALPFLAAFTKKISRTAAFYMIMFAIMAFISTGAFQLVQLPGVSLLYPMLREVGHAAPVMVLFLVLAVSELDWPEPLAANVGLVGFLAVFMGLNVFIYWRYVPRIDFAQARNEFAQFYDFNSTDTSASRLLTYPFFNQYSFTSQPQTVIAGTPMSNSGWDSFTIFSGKEYIDNAVPADPASFQGSIQYRFLQSFDTSILKEYNVKFIYDYSKIYRSNFASFSKPEVYGGNPGVINNYPDFTARILAKNPATKEVAPGVIELGDSLPRLYSDNTTFTRLSSDEYRLTITGIKGPQQLIFLNSYHPGWKLYALPNGDNPIACAKPTSYPDVKTSECEAATATITGNELGYHSSDIVAQGSHKQWLDYANVWTLDPNELKQHTSSVQTNADGSINVSLALYYQPQTNYLAALGLSILTIITSLAYLVIRKIKKYASA